MYNTAIQVFSFGWYRIYKSHRCSHQTPHFVLLENQLNNSFSQNSRKLKNLKFNIAVKNRICLPAELLINRPGIQFLYPVK